MKTPSLIFILTFSILLSSAAVNAQSVYHVDPNNNVGMSPNNIRKSNTVNGIYLSNNYSKEISILLSNDNVSWDTTKVTAKSSMHFKQNTKYVKIFSSGTNFSTRKMSSGNCYSIYWDNSKRKWDIK